MYIYRWQTSNVSEQYLYVTGLGLPKKYIPQNRLLLYNPTERIIVCIVDTDISNDDMNIKMGDAEGRIMPYIKSDSMHKPVNIPLQFILPTIINCLDTQSNWLVKGSGIFQDLSVYSITTSNKMIILKYIQDITAIKPRVFNLVSGSTVVTNISKFGTQLKLEEDIDDSLDDKAYMSHIIYKLGLEMGITYFFIDLKLPNPDVIVEKLPTKMKLKRFDCIRLLDDMRTIRIFIEANEDDVLAEVTNQLLTMNLVLDSKDTSVIPNVLRFNYGSY